MKGRTNGWMDEWTDGWMDERTDEGTDGWMGEPTDGWRDGWMDERTDEGTDGWMDGRTDGWMDRRSVEAARIFIPNFICGTKKQNRPCSESSEDFFESEQRSYKSLLHRGVCRKNFGVGASGDFH